MDDVKMSKTMKKVAQLAGTSTATVSHVINGTRFVSEETKQRVQEAMEKLDYTPNYTARNLRRQKTNIIGVILPDISNYFFTSLIQGIESTLRKEGYQLLVSNSDELVSSEIEQIKTFNAQLVQGLIIASSAENYAEIKPYIKYDIPTVFIDRKPKGVPHDVIAVKNKIAVYEAITYLIQKSCKKIALIAGTPNISTTKERIEGYVSALEDHDIDVKSSLIKNGDSKFKSGYLLAKELYEQEIVDSIFVANNLMTIGAITYFKENGVKIPEDVSIIGFDDYEWAIITDPPLSVIKQPSKLMGEKAASLIIEKINTPEKETSNYYFPTELMIRKSC
ncbi:LacI family DNA-binding transcriptional regulator [Amphibacillus sp. Q70]|uniref:LacI family DNA-binding transcriptional regulator n=1 Tax=Amphibacillus sp. Q70 TaxID=3453416 RepID=UPI003F84F218